MSDTNNKIRRTFDWPALKKEFITGDYKNLSEFKREKGIAQNMSKPFKGWIEEKKEVQERALEAAKEEVVRVEAENTVEVRERQARLARFLQLKGAETLKNTEITNADDARKMIISGMQEERKVLGIEGKGKGDSYTQVNIGPTTNLDNLVEGLDYEGILKLIAELKRERARRSIPGDDDEGFGETENGEVL